MILQEISKDKTKYNTAQSGLTMVEVLLVTALSAILVGTAIPMIGNLQGSAQLNNNSSRIIQSVRIARERSVNRLNNKRHGIYFDVSTEFDKYVLYQGDSYASRDIEFDIETELPDVLILTTTVVGNEINFSRGNGVPDEIGIINIDHRSGGGRSININSIGLTEES